MSTRYLHVIRRERGSNQTGSILVNTNIYADGYTWITPQTQHNVVYHTRKYHTHTYTHRYNDVAHIQYKQQHTTLHTTLHNTTQLYVTINNYNYNNVTDRHVQRVEGSSDDWLDDEMAGWTTRWPAGRRYGRLEDETAGWRTGRRTG